MLACEEARWKKALESDRRRGQGQDELNKLGLVVVGDHVLPMGLNDLTFATIWRDGKEPEFTTNKSPAELARMRQETIARGNAISAEMQAKEQGLRRDIESSQAEEVFMAKIDKNFGAKSYPKPFQNLVRSMKGWTEQEIIEAWGYPDDERHVGSNRMWVYYNQKDERVANVVSKYGHVAVTGDLRECELMLILREGGKKTGRTALRLSDGWVELQCFHNDARRPVTRPELQERGALYTICATPRISLYSAMSSIVVTTRQAADIIDD